MNKRFVSIWFGHLVTDCLTRRQPDLKDIPFVLTILERGRTVVTGVNGIAELAGVMPGMTLADARTLEPAILDFDDKPNLPESLLNGFADWCLRYTPSVSVSLPDGLILDITGCAHLMGGESKLLKDLVMRLREAGYHARAALADTVGAAWAVARYGRDRPIIPTGAQRSALAALPPAGLRLSLHTLQRLKKLGIRTIADLQILPKATLTRRFGTDVVLRLNQANGEVAEAITVRRPITRYRERLLCPEGTSSAEGIAAALSELLKKICVSFEADQIGVRSLVFQGLRLDGKMEEVEVGTSRATRSQKHLYKLFENKLPLIEPALGIELFILSAPHTEALGSGQNVMLSADGSIDDEALPELVDRLTAKVGHNPAVRFLPSDKHWPERSIKKTQSLSEETDHLWPKAQLRPVRMLARPEVIEVIAPVPDYPPRMFRHRGKHHKIIKADGPERIEREWWLDTCEPRDYYRVEDEAGQRYWLFRSGHYRHGEPSHWFLHGYFA